MRNRLTARQINAWSLCTLSVPATLALSGCGWVWVLGGSVLAGVLTAAAAGMQRRAGTGMREALVFAFGIRSGRILAACSLAWLLFAAAGAAAACQTVFEDDLGPFAPAVPLLLAALACGKGRAAAGRVCAVLAMCAAGLYAIIAAASLRHIQGAWCRPWGVPADAALAFCLCLTPAGLLFMTDGDETAAPSPAAAAANALLPAVPAFLAAACLSPELARAERLPLLTLSKSLSVLSVMQRFELLLSVAQMLGVFSLLAMLACAALHMTEIFRTERSGKAGGGVFCLLALGGSFLMQWVPLWVWAVGTAIFWGVMPILTQVIVNIKKTEK